MGRVFLVWAATRDRLAAQPARASLDVRRATVPGGSPALPGDRQPGLSRPGQHRVPQSRPQGEHVSYPNGDASLILYEDPPGISGENYPTNGALLYASPQAGNDGSRFRGDLYAA